MISRGNVVIVAFGGLAILLLYVVSTFTTMPTWVGIAVVVIVGVIVPQVINESLSRR